MTQLLKIEGIGEKYFKKLADIDVKTVEQLLKNGATPSGRAGIAEKAGIDPHLILEWVNHADLFRIKGIGEEYSDLLEEAGVDTVVELSKRVPANLFKKLQEVNVEKKLCRRLPTLGQVQAWIEEAKSLPRIISY